jgi:hypothetical protein
MKHPAAMRLGVEDSERILHASRVWIMSGNPSRVATHLPANLALNVRGVLVVVIESRLPTPPPARTSQVGQFFGPLP